MGGSGHEYDKKCPMWSSKFTLDCSDVSSFILAHVAKCSQLLVSRLYSDSPRRDLALLTTAPGGKHRVQSLIKELT